MFILALLLQSTNLLEDPPFLAAHGAWARCTNRAADAELGSARSAEEIAAAAQAACTAEQAAVRGTVIAHSGAADGPELMQTLLDADRTGLVERVVELRRRAAAQVQAADAMRPEVEAAFGRARLAWLQCLRRQADAPRRANREAAIDAAFAACQGDAEAMRAALRRQYNEPSVDSLMASLGAAIRDSLRTYLRR